MTDTDKFERSKFGVVSKILSSKLVDELNDVDIFRVDSSEVGLPDDGVVVFKFLEEFTDEQIRFYIDKVNEEHTKFKKVCYAKGSYS